MLRNFLLALLLLALFLSPALSAGTAGACLSTSDCDAELSCQTITTPAENCSSSSTYCVCVPDGTGEATLCEDSPDACRDSETCISAPLGIPGAVAVIGQEVCVDKAQASAVETINVCTDEKKCPGGQVCVLEEDIGAGSCLAAPGKGGDDVCIAVQSLRGVTRGMLVRQQHAMARVMCDRNGSCATKGHMVEFRGRVMMMGSYCALVGCKEEVMLVNSPRYGRAARFASHTDGLLWTSFAARYGSKVEEHLLRAAVYAGF